MSNGACKTFCWNVGEVNHSTTECLITPRCDAENGQRRASQSIHLGSDRVEEKGIIAAKPSGAGVDACRAWLIRCQQRQLTAMEGDAGCNRATHISRGKRPPCADRIERVGARNVSGEDRRLDISNGRWSHWCHNPYLERGSSEVLSEIGAKNVALGTVHQVLTLTNADTHDSSHVPNKFFANITRDRGLKSTRE